MLLSVKEKQVDNSLAAPIKKGSFRKVSGTGKDDAKHMFSFLSGLAGSIL